MCFIEALFILLFYHNLHISLSLRVARSISGIPQEMIIDQSSTA